MTEQGPSFEERKWAHELQIEERRWLHDLQRDDAKRAHDVSTEFHTYTNKAALEGANMALRTLILINGGAAIAVLTFLGGVASKDKVDFAQVGAVAGTIKYFAWGVALALAAMAFAYLTHYFMTGREGKKLKTWEHPFVQDTPASLKSRKLNVGVHIASVACALISLILFMAGMFAASDKVTHLLVK